MAQGTGNQEQITSMGLHIYSRVVVVATFLLIIAGGLVTSQNYGLAVPDWPKSYGQWMPPMVGGVLYEHGHRMIAGFVGLLTVGLMVWVWWKEKRRVLRVLATAALFAVVLQAILGGLTVLYKLPAPISVMHATLAQTFFCLLVTILLLTSPAWKELSPAVVTGGRVRYLFLATTALIYFQLIVGASMRHTDAALAIPDFPLAFGRLVPEFSSPEIVIHYIHRVNAILILILAFRGANIAAHSFTQQKGIYYPGILLLGLVIVQGTLGAFTVLMKTAVPVATAHVAFGALTLACSLVCTIVSFRICRREPSSFQNAPITQPMAKAI